MRAVLAHDFRWRASPAALPERMDAEADYETFRDTVASLTSVNRMTMGYRPLRWFLHRYTNEWNFPVPLRILDVGSGYGDGTRAAADYLDRWGHGGRVVGVDRNPHAARAAGEIDTSYDETELSYVTADVFEHAEEALPYDLIVSALFTHHLEDAEVVRFLRWMEDTAQDGWLVNDLYRSKVAAIGFGLLARLLRRHSHVQHDGPVSFARSFRRRDWQRLLAEAGVEGAELRMLAPFRLCVVRDKR